MYELTLLVSLVVITIIALYLVATGFRVYIRNQAPFVPVHTDILEHVAKELDITEHSKIYDLGSGDGRILKFLHNKYPHASYIGVELDLFPYLLSRLYNRKIFSNSFTIKRKNFFKEDISSATHVITYLLPTVMDQLLPKLEKELAPGTILVSIDFSFSHKEPIKKFKPDLNTDRTLGRTVLVYRF